MKNSNKRTTLRRLLKYLNYRPWILGLIVALVIWAGVVNVYGIYLMRDLIAAIGVVDWDIVVKEIISLAAFFLSGVVAFFIYNPLMVYYSQTVISRMREDMFVHMQKLPLSYFDSQNRGKIMSYFTNDVDTLNQALNTGFTTIIYSIVTGIGTIIFMFIVNVPLSFIVIFFLILMFIFVFTNSAKSRKAFKQNNGNVATLNSYIEEMIVGLKVSAMFDHHADDLAEFKRRNNQLRKSGELANEYSLRTVPFIVSLSYFNYAVSAVIGALFVINGRLDIAGLAVYLIYVRQSSNPFSQFTNQLNAIINGVSGADRIFEFLDLEHEIDEGDITLVSAVEINGKIEETEHPTNSIAWKIPRPEGGYDYKMFAGLVEFKNVSFGYKKEEPVLRNISLYASKGEKVALVGSTGAGKTTIINLITRFYEIDEGVITYDGIDITRIRKDDLRRCVSVVIQDTHLFNDTIFNNIAYPLNNPTNAEVELAARIAHVDSFVNLLADGYNTMLHDDGANLSAGQRQLIAIARAAILQPPVLILDEATSSIDSRSEKLIQKAMDEITDNKTVFVIAHRLSTIKNAKAILVLEKGSIIERGNHETLLNEQKTYYYLYTGQFDWQ